MARPRYGYERLKIEDFSGGWNPRDAWSEIARNEMPDMMNMTLEERGGVVKRLGLTRLNAGAQISNGGNIQSLYYSAATDRLLAQIGLNLYASSNGGVSWGSALHTFSTNARCHMVDFLGVVVIIHPADNVRTYNGTAVSGVVANSPDGTCIAVWQNALWSIGDPAAPSRVTRSDLGAATWPASPITVDIRVKDDKPLTAIGGGQGMDEQGRDGILVWKEDSHYRINNSSTGAYTVEDFQYGASGAMCVTTTAGVTCGLSRKGIVANTGGTPELVSTKIEPLFHPSQMTFANSHVMLAANTESDRMVFSMPFTDGVTANSLTLEYSPKQGWFAPHSFGISAATNYTKNTQKLYGGKVGTGSSTYGYLLDVFSGAQDDGAPITSRFQTRWFEPNVGSDVRYRRAVINGRGSFTFYVKRNYDTGAGDSYQVAIQGDGSLWGSAIWGTDTWDAPLQQDYVEIFSLGHGRSISMEVQETSSTTSTRTALLDIGAEEPIGGFAVYGISVDMVSLGTS